MIRRMLKKAAGRYIVLCLLVAFSCAVMALRLFNLQVIEGARYVPQQAVAVKTRSVPEAAPRGRILDRNGVPIAINRESFQVHIVDAGLDDDGLNAVLLAVADILGRAGDDWDRSIEKYLAIGEGGEPAFVGADAEAAQAAAVAWQAGTLSMGAQDVTRDPGELLAYLRSERMYSVSPRLSQEDAWKVVSLRYLITVGKGAFEGGSSTCLARGVSTASIAQIEEQGFALQGVLVGTAPVREYRDATSVAHVLGYVGAITEEDFKEMEADGYAIDATVGQYGVERQDEAYLRGRAGTRLVQITDGAVADAAEGGSPATQGCDVTLTIDMDLQKAALSSLERNIQCIREERDNGYMETKSDVNFRDADSGAAVAVDVRTGEVLAMVSSPTYDPTIFLRDDAEARQAIADLWQDPLKGALNRAIQGTYTPGSTFKPLTAIAALEEGVINRNTERVDEGVIEFSGMKFRCLEKPYEGHGAQTLKQALEVSCNIFFYQIGVDTTIDNLEKWAKLFGLGVKTGIDLPYEAAGTMSSKAFKLEKQKDIWRPADTAQTSIGQMFNSFTPLQMACYMAALANGGLYYTPYVTKEVTRYDGSPVRKAKPEARRIPVSAESIDAVKEGMVNSTTSIDGTASEAFAGFPFAVAGKTGTAQTGYENQDQSSNSLFVCYAPADDPEIAVAVVIEKGVWGSYTAPVARDILESYFGLTGSASEKAATGDAASALVP